MLDNLYINLNLTSFLLFVQRVTDFSLFRSLCRNKLKMMREAFLEEFLFALRLLKHVPSGGDCESVTKPMN